MQEVNSLRRLLAFAENDFYELSRAYALLRDNQNRDVLVSLIGKVNV